MHGSVELYLALARVEHGLVDELAAIKSCRSAAARGQRSLAGRKFRQKAIGEATHEQGQARRGRDGNLLQRGPESAAARDLDYKIVHQALGGIMEKVGGADAGLAYRQRQRALLAQPPHEMHLIRRKRLLQDADACISEAPS